MIRLGSLLEPSQARGGLVGRIVSWALLYRVMLELTKLQRAAKHCYTNVSRARTDSKRVLVTSVVEQQLGAFRELSCDISLQVGHL